jgi:hypothetical protein
MICEVCTGRGWIRHPTRTAVECPFCGGRAELSWGFVARKINEHPATLARVRQLRSKEKVCLRVLEKVASLLWPPKQSEMFQ